MFYDFQARAKNNLFYSFNFLLFAILPHPTARALQFTPQSQNCKPRCRDINGSTIKRFT
jgi:hypothetical protein